ncbi:MAG: DUF6958 family protein [Gelidibacter sp.]|uniref:DUF6958 family protein n=1 Tax=Gelidibacter sp. TaxID=2018083 RepID=UPI003266BCC7
MEQRIQLIHPEGKKAVTMNKSKYDALKNALLNQLKKNGELTHVELLDVITQDFKKNKIQFEGSIPWHMEWVKLDLEANKIIQRVKDTAPQKYTLK